MLNTCRLHEVGILHGNLLDGHHFVRMGNGIRILDFSTAVRHRCCGGVPILLHARKGEAPGGCTELLHMEATYGIHSDHSAMRNAGRRLI